MAGDNKSYIKSSNVINLCDLKKYFDSFNDGTNLTDLEIKNIYDKLLVSNVEVSKDVHIANIRKTQFQVENNICPRCGEKLVIRTGKYGKFYGCSNYPKCRFIKKI